jgi:hypothetical protein
MAGANHMGDQMSRTRTVAVVIAALGAIVAVGCTPQTPGGGGSFAPAGCYDSPVADAPDFRFNGVPNQKNNLLVSIDIATFTLSTDGSCAGIQLADPYAFTLVRATSESAAAALCESLGLPAGAGQIQAEYPDFPADGWVCNPPPAA